ncbi:MAG: AEC family transporter [Paracoccaceae bacterium]|nr:AEC family transporter [Paracoccaceae bacterium]MDE2912455.1 AEC family transporter [Paracoccaceae bacterium]
MTSEILNIITPVFVVAGIGFFLEYQRIGFHSETLSRLAMQIGTPSLVFSTLTGSALPDESLARIVAITVAAVILGGALALAALLVLRLPWRTFLSSLSIPNAGNAGLPIVFFAFAEPGLAIGAAFYFTISLVQYTTVPAIVTGDPSLRKLLRIPLVWAIVALLFFRITDLPVPTVIADTTALLGGLMIPVMLILLGAALARLKVGDIGTSALLACVRLAVGVATGLTLVTIFNLEGMEAGAIFLLTVMPSALFTYLVAEHFGRNAERVAGLVVSSTVLNFACLPLLITAAIFLAGL